MLSVHNVPRGDIMIKKCNPMTNVTIQPNSIMLQICNTMTCVRLPGQIKNVNFFSSDMPQFGSEMSQTLACVALENSQIRTMAKIRDSTSACWWNAKIDSVPDLRLPASNQNQMVESESQTQCAHQKLHYARCNTDPVALTFMSQCVGSSLSSAKIKPSYL